MAWDFISPPLGIENRSQSTLHLPHQFKKTSMMKKTAMMAIMGLFLFASCEKDEEFDNKIENEYFSVENGVFNGGAFPSSTLSQSMGEVSINKNAIPGGSSYVTILTDEPMSEFYVGVSGIEGHIVVPATPATRAGENEYSLLLLLSQNLEQAFTLMLSGRGESGEIYREVNESISFIGVGTGALQVSLSFNNDTDVDLYVVRPNGEVIYYGNEGGYDEDGEVWGLDLDSNPACDIDGVNNENIFFPTSELLPGKYEVWVNLYENCNGMPTIWAITATNNGATITPSYGKNPATGTFAGNAPSNDISSNLNELAIKVMEFTISGTRTSVNSYSSHPIPKSVSAIHKEQVASR